MAKIHGISACTRILLNKIKPIHGKRPTTLDEILFIRDNYSTFLEKAKETASKQQDDLIASLTHEEIQIDQQIKNDIAKQEKDRETHIENLCCKVEESESFFPMIKYLLQYFIAILTSGMGIKPPEEYVRKLRNVKERKSIIIRQKASFVENSVKDIYETQSFFLANYSFITGAEGEELVIRALSGLSDEYYIINDVFFNLSSNINEEKSTSEETVQIDHIVIGPTGLFLLETKNWEKYDSEWKDEKLKYQVHRANRAMRRYLKTKFGNSMPWTQSVVISIQSNQPEMKIDQYIDMIAPSHLCEYIRQKKRHVSNEKINDIVLSIPFR
jgi:hypothetical protein